MKKITAIMLVLATVLCVFVGCSKKSASTAAPASAAYKIAMVTDSGDITDHSFNQTTYEAIVAFAKDTATSFTYYKPSGDSDAERTASIEKAIDDGFNVIVTPGYMFAPAVKAVAKENPDVKFITLDIGAGDWGDGYTLPQNVYAAVYAEQYCGFMAGYAAVKLGYTKLGYLGGMAVPAVKRYGYGFVQGADTAAQEMGIKIELKYIYGNQFFGDADITAVMDTWYANGTEVVFACGGGIWMSAAESAAKYGKKVIGVDTDQSFTINGMYGDGLTVTSATKGLYPTTYNTLKDVVVNGNWAKYAGKLETLGLISGTDPDANYVGIATATTQYNDKFTKNDVVTLCGKLFNGQYKVTDDTVVPATKTFTFVDLGNIK